MKRTAATLLALGTITVLGGFTFALQGLGIIGPAGSFMYESPGWVRDGSAIGVLGLVIIAAAVVLGRRRTG